jgi:hypothetical protein
MVISRSSFDVHSLLRRGKWPQICAVQSSGSLAGPDVGVCQCWNESSKTRFFIKPRVKDDLRCLLEFCEILTSQTFIVCRFVS